MPVPNEVTLGCRVRVDPDSIYAPHPWTGTVLAISEQHIYVLRDNERPDRLGQMRCSAIAPRLVSRIPDDWLHSLGMARCKPTSVFAEPDGSHPGAVRYHQGVWLLCNKQRNGLGSGAYSHATIGELLASWRLRLLVDEYDRNRVLCEVDKDGCWWPSKAVQP